MPGFKVPSTILDGVRSFGAQAPATAFYAVTITNEEFKGGKRTRKYNLPTTRTDITVNIEGFEKLEFLNIPMSEDGRFLDGYIDSEGNWASEHAASSFKGQLGAAKAIWESAGIDLSEGVATGALKNRTAYVEWHNADDTGERYGEIARWLTKEIFEQYQREGRKPQVKRVEQSPAGGAQAGTAMPDTPTHTPSMPGQSTPSMPGQGGGNNVGATPVPRTGTTELPKLPPFPG